jgi:mono/diheme cytochrome c family protein
MLVLLGLVACGNGESTGGDATAGAAVYSANCESCHGADGTVGVNIGGTPASDLNDEVPEKSDDELASIILDGTGSMPAISMSETEAADCVAYLRETFP